MTDKWGTAGARAMAGARAGRGTAAETVAVLGAGGTMGFPIARNIARAGLPARVWDQVAGKVRPLAGDGAFLARTPGEAARGAGIVITMLADEEAVAAAMRGPGGALAAMTATTRERAGGASGPFPPLWVQMGTIGIAATGRCADLARRSGVGFVDAPVLGTRQPAEEAKLVVLESGPEEAGPRLRPVFGAIGQRTIRAGEAGAGSRLKLVAVRWVLAVTGEAVTGEAGPGPEPGLPSTGGAPGPRLIEAVARRFAEAAEPAGAAGDGYFGAGSPVSEPEQPEQGDI